MILEHVAIWTEDLDLMKGFYCNHFGAKAGAKYENPEKEFESYFLEFDSGARLELMKMKSTVPNPLRGDGPQHQGIIHIAFGMETIHEVDQKAEYFRSQGIALLGMPRRTGDGYYEFEMLDPENNRLEVTARATQ